MTTSKTFIGTKVINDYEEVTNCDICGYEYADNETGGFEHWFSEMSFYWRQMCSEGLSTGFVVKDVCPQCAEKIREFIESLGGKVSEPWDGILAARGELHRHD